MQKVFKKINTGTFRANKIIINKLGPIYLPEVCLKHEVDHYVLEEVICPMPSGK